MINNKDIATDLDNKYKTDLLNYYDKIKFLKGAGYRIFRNANGEHKVEHNDNYIYEAFDGIFGDIFK